MAVVFSRACSYAIRALVEMARHPEQQRWSVQHLARDLNIPPPFLAKTFQTLVQREILRSTRGRRGGFSFTRSADRISLLDVVTAIDGDGLVEHCILGFPECGDEHPCAFHAEWETIRKHFFESMANKSILDFARKLPERA